MVPLEAMHKELINLSDISQTLDKELIMNLGSCDGLVPKVMILIENYAEISGDDLSPNLLANLTQDVIDLLKHDTLEDVALMFKFARQGKLELDTFAKKKSLYLTITQDFIPSYLRLKAKKREEIHYRKKKSYEASIIEIGESAETGKMDPEEFRKRIKELRLSLNPPDRIKNKPNPIILGNLDTNTPMDSSDAFRERLIEDVKKWNYNHIRDKIDEWSLLKNEGRYVDVLENELESRKKK